MDYHKHSNLVANVQRSLEAKYAAGADLIGEFYDPAKEVLIQNYQCAHTQGNTVLVIVQYLETGAHINVVGVQFIIQ